MNDVLRKITVWTGLLSTLLWSSTGMAQWYATSAFPVERGGAPLANPWTGGFDRAQLSMGDLTGDGSPELVVFDAEGESWRIYERDAGHWAHRPALTARMPEVRNFAAVHDFNGDGVGDVYAWTNNGIQVFRGEVFGDGPVFEIAKPRLRFDNGFSMTPIYLRPGDIPAIEDFDGDGDLDIAAFDVLGTALPYYRNISVESGYGLDSLVYERFDPCWGDFQESSTDNTILLDLPCGGMAVQNGRPKHAGSSVTAYRDSATGPIQILLGDISFSYLTGLHAIGPVEDPVVDAYDTLWPVNDVPADLPFFPAAYWIDHDLDGTREMVVTPNSATEHVNIRNLWTYEPDPATEWRLTDRRFLVGETVDVGEDSHALWYDADADGLLDLLVASSIEYGASLRDTGRIVFLRNTGTASEPAFTWADDDLWNLSQLDLERIRPALGDLDGDGDDDLVLGDRSGGLTYLENTAGAGAPPVFAPATTSWFNIDAGSLSHPDLHDVNGDGLLDLMVGKAYLGRINYYWNHGTAAAPEFHVDSVNDFFGAIAVDSAFVNGSSSPALRQEGADLILSTGSFLSGLRRYRVDPDSLRSGRFRRAEAGDAMPRRPSYHTTVSVADVNGDGFDDMAVGCAEGGVLLYSKAVLDSSDFVGLRPVKDRLTDISLFPNPTTGRLEIHSQASPGRYAVIDGLGRVIASGRIEESKTVLDLSGQSAPGMHVLLLTADDGRRARKRFVLR